MFIFYSADHKLKGVDPKPRISLVEDPDNHFTSVIHTPLPPPPISSPSSLYSPVRKKTSPNSRNESSFSPHHERSSFSHNERAFTPYNERIPSSYNERAISSHNEPLYSPVRTKQSTDFPYKKTSASADSLLNSNRSETPVNGYSRGQETYNYNRHSNLSYTNHHNSNTTPSHHNTSKSYSSNPNILSDAGNLVPACAASIHQSKRSQSIQPLVSPDAGHKNHFVRHNSISHRPAGYGTRSPTADLNNFNRSYSTRVGNSGFVQQRLPALSSDDTNDVILRNQPS